MTERQCTRCGYRTDSDDHEICLECHEGKMDLTHQDKIRFHNAIVDLANRYGDIAKVLSTFAAALCKGECKDITEDRAKDILNRLPCRDVDRQEAAVEHWMQRFFS